MLLLSFLHLYDIFCIFNDIQDHPQIPLSLSLSYVVRYQLHRAKLKSKIKMPQISELLGFVSAVDAAMEMRSGFTFAVPGKRTRNIKQMESKGYAKSFCP